MEKLVLEPRSQTEVEPKFSKKMQAFQRLLDELAEREIPEGIARSIAADVSYLNAQTTGNLRKSLPKKQSEIIRLLEKELKIVPKSHYQNLWMILGMSAFGLPIGVAISSALGNMAFLAIGFPIGMPIGLAIGASLDKKAAREGRQLNINLNG